MKYNLKTLPNSLMISGLLYPVVWMALLYFAWVTEPLIISELDLVTSFIILVTAFGLYKNREVISHNIVIRLLQVGSLIYATIWTVIIMFIYESAIAGALLPIDLISLYATTTLAVKIWKAA